MERTRAFTNALIDLASSPGPASGSVATVARTYGRGGSIQRTLGWGFISGSDGVRYFVHYTGIVGTGFRSLAPNQQVEFTPMSAERGPKAVDVA